MVIDSHNHLGGPDKGDGKCQSAGDLLARMDGAGVDKAVVFPFNVADPGVSFSNANNYIADSVAGHPDRLIGFCRLDPNYGDMSVRELSRCVGGLGMKGVKLHPTSQVFGLGHPALLDILSLAQELGIPALFDTGKAASPPEGISMLALRFPRLTIIMAHMNLYDESVAAARRAPNIVLGTTGYFNIKRLGEAIMTLGASRFAAGSDSPYIHMESEVGKFYKIDGLTDEERRLILGGNIRAILNV